jgi:hypothetical protein
VRYRLDIKERHNNRIMSRRPQSISRPRAVFCRSGDQYAHQT